MKNVLVLSHDDAGQEARLQAGLDVTRALDGHLTCLDVMAMPTVYTGVYGFGGEELVLARVREWGEEKRARLIERLAREDVSYTVLGALGEPAAALTQAADLADLIVVTSRTGTGPDEPKHARPTGLPVRAKRPVLAVPPESRGFDPATPVIVAWDGSDEAAEALRAAVPLMQRAKDVTVLRIGRETGENTIEEAGAYLSRHGIHAELLQLPESETTAGSILQIATERSAGWIVMGAYGMGRAAERLFGGVTRTMLLDSAVPLLIAH